MIKANGKQPIVIKHRIKKFIYGELSSFEITPVA